MLDERQIAVERFCAKIGYALRMARLHRGLTISELADKSGVSRKDIRNLERGENYSASLRAIAEAFFALDFEPEFRVAPISALATAALGQDAEERLEAKPGKAAREAGNAQPEGSTP